MVESVDGFQRLANNARPNSRMGSIDSESYDNPKYLQDGIDKSKAELKKFRPDQPQKTNESKQPKIVNSKGENVKCPKAKPQEVKPKEPSDKEKLENAKKEKAELFKELKAGNVDPIEAVKELTKLKETFSALDDIFRAKLAQNQKDKDAYNPSRHTDIDGNNNKAKDKAFYDKINASTVEYTSMRSEIHREMRSINTEMLRHEMNFLRA